MIVWPATFSLQLTLNIKFQLIIWTYLTKAFVSNNLHACQVNEMWSKRIHTFFNVASLAVIPNVLSCLNLVAFKNSVRRLNYSLDRFI